MNDRQTRRALLAALAASTLPGAGRAQEAFPQRPMRLIVPFAPGNSTDTMARTLAEGLRRELGQAVNVENKTGANAMIAGQYLLQLPADGHTLMFASDSALVLNGLLYKNPGYVAERDFVPVAQVADVPQVLVVNHQVTARTLADFVAQAKAQPGRLNFGSTGIGGSFHLAGELFKQLAGVDMVHVPYKGGAPALQALLGGEIQLMFGVVGSLLPHIKAGKLRPLGMATRARVAVLPEVPTIAESGYPDYESSIRYGLVVARGTPPALVARLSDAVQKVSADPAVRQGWIEQGYTLPGAHTPAQYAAVLERDRKTWGTLIKARGLSLD